jgi:hypothetical protein
MKPTFLAAVFALIASSALAGPPDQSVLVELTGHRVDGEMLSVLEEQWSRSFPPGFHALRQQGVPIESDLVVVGEISRLGGNYYVRLHLNDGKTGQTERNVEKTCPATEDALSAILNGATAELLGVPSASQPSPGRANLVPSDAPTTTYVKVPNKNKQKALYVCIGGALVASAGTLAAVLNNGNDQGWSAVSGTAIAGGLTAFSIGGAVYVLSNDHEIRVIAAPAVTGKSTGVAVAGQF